MNEYDTTIDHHESDLVGAYVLDALEESERDSFEIHLIDCATCRMEVVDLMQVVDVLPLAVEPVEPPAEVKSRLLEAVASDSVVRPSLMSIPGSAPAPRRRRSINPYVSVLGLAAAVVIAALGFWNVQLQGQVSHEKMNAAYARDVSHAILNGATVAALSPTQAGASTQAALVQPKNGGSPFLLIGNMPSAPKNKVYELWYLRGSKPYRVKVFNPSGTGTSVVPLSTPATTYGVAAITVENGPNGSAKPTTSPIMAGKLRA
jgi:anti-sigma factor RsiW